MPAKQRVSQKPEAPTRPKLDRVLDSIATQLYAGHELVMAVRDWHGDSCNVPGCAVDAALSAYYRAIACRLVRLGGAQ